MKLFGHSEAWVKRHEQAELAQRVAESNERFANFEISDADLDSLPEAPEADSGTRTASEEPLNEPTRQDTYTAHTSSDDALANFELHGYVSSVSSGNHITFYNKFNETVFDGSTEQAANELFSLSPELLAGVYGGGIAGMDAAMSTVQDLIDADKSGKAESMLRANEALSSSYLAYLNPKQSPATAVAES